MAGNERQASIFAVGRRVDGRWKGKSTGGLLKRPQLQDSKQAGGEALGLYSQPRAAAAVWSFQPLADEGQ